MTESNVFGELISMTVGEGNILFIHLVAMIMNKCSKAAFKRF